MAGDTPVEFLVEGLAKAFGDKQVLRGIDLTVRQGDVVAIVGGSGCGKTVLLNHILGQLAPDTGRVWVVNHERPEAPLVDIARVDDLELAQVHRHWGVVFQRNALFSGSVLDNIALWLAEVRGLDDDQVLPIAQAALRAVSLPADAAFLATGSESLSGGMAKRLAVARALAMDPTVMFYDEPTTGLDPTSTMQIQDLIGVTHAASAPGNTPRTTLIVTHDKDLLVRLRPRIVMLHEGRVSFDGGFDAFQASASPIIRPYFDLMPALHVREPAASPV